MACRFVLRRERRSLRSRYFGEIRVATYRLGGDQRQGGNMFTCTIVYADNSVSTAEFADLGDAQAYAQSRRIIYGENFSRFVKSIVIE